MTTIFAPGTSGGPQRVVAEMHLENDDIVVQQITPEAWRIRDRRLPEHDALCVLGVIERLPDGSFESLILGGGAQRSFSSDFTGALGHFTPDVSTLKEFRNVNS